MSRDGIIERDERKTLFEYEILAFDRQVAGSSLDISCRETFLIGWRRYTDTGVYSAATELVNAMGSRLLWRGGQFWGRRS